MLDCLCAINSIAYPLSVFQFQRSLANIDTLFWQSVVDQTNSAPDVPSGLVEFREECAVREQSTQARGSSKKTGTEFTWSPDSPSATGHWTPSQLSLVERQQWWNRWPPSFSATWVAWWLPVYIEACSHLGRTYCDATCALWICEASNCWRRLLC